MPSRFLFLGGVSDGAHSVHCGNSLRLLAGLYPYPGGRTTIYTDTKLLQLF